MLKTLFRNTLRLAIRNRKCSCWCPQGPLDPATSVLYLNNGIRIVTEETNSPLACVSLVAAVGSRYETANCNGITHFIEHMAYKGFMSFSKDDVEDYALKKGAKFTVETGREMQRFSILLPANLAPDALCFLFKIIQDLRLDDDEIEQERHNLCLEMVDADNNPKDVVFEYLHSTAFQGTPLGQPVIGPTRNIRRYDKNIMCRYLYENYTTYRLILATSGGVCHNQILEETATTFGQLCPLGYWDTNPGPCRFTGSQVLYRNDAMPFAHVAIAIEGPGYTSPDYLAMIVMKCLIGSWHRSQGRPTMQPFSTARDASVHGVCESYESFYIPYKDVGLWGVYFVADKMRLDEMVSFVQHAWMNMTVSAHAIETQKAVNMAKMIISKRYTGVVNSCRDVGIQMLYNCTRSPLNMLLSQLDAINSVKIRALSEKYIYARSPAVAGMGPVESLPPYNRTESGMYWLRW